MTELKDIGITKSKKNQCKCRGNTESLVYTLPKKIEDELIGYLKPIGEPTVSFNKTSLLKIETPAYSITGVRRFSQITVTIKKEGILDINLLEDCLKKYVKKE